MPIDAYFVKHLANELNTEISGSNIKKIYNISNNDFVFKLHTKQQLYISCNNEARVNLTTNNFVFPKTPSNFTMQLRKYLSNYKIVNIENYHNDRILKLTMHGINELRDKTTLYLFIEIFGRYSNIILTDDNNKIITALKLVNKVSATILPNATYQIVAQTSLKTTTKYDLSKVNLETVNPTMTTKDFYFTNIFKAGTTYPSLSVLLDTYYYELDKHRRRKHLEAASTVKIEQEYKKQIKKLANLQNDLAKNQNYEKYKNYGDLILTYGYANNDLASLTCNDFNNQQVTIPLDSRLSISANANKYYEKYAKLKRSISHLEAQISKTSERIEYLNTLLFQVSISDEKALEEIYAEFNHKQQNRKKQQTKSTIMKLAYEDAVIYVGKNNVQNNEVTFKLSKKQDYWFHAYQVPGAHVLLKCDNITPDIIEYAASIAAYYSKNSNDKVAVQYTQIKNVKKVPNSYLGHVIVKEFKTIIVEQVKEKICKHQK